MSATFKKDIEAMYILAAKCESLAVLVPELCEVLRRNCDSLADVTYAYRLRATDSGYTYAFALYAGVFTELSAGDRVDVTVLGSEANLLAVFQRKLNPAAGLLLGKIKVEGSKSALLKLASFL